MKRKTAGSSICNPVIKDENLDHELKIREFKWSEKQKEIITAILDKKTKIIFIEGCAGTGKSILAIYCALHLLNNHKINDIRYYRTVVECGNRSMGFLPGSVEEKIEPYLGPLNDKLEELLSKADANFLIKEKRVAGAPINFLRGASINNSCVIFDELQNATIAEATTVLSRIGEYSKFICIGDTKQSDLGAHKSCLKTLSMLFDDQESKNNGVYSFALGHEDIVRSEILKFVMKKLETLQ